MRKQEMKFIWATTEVAAQDLESAGMQLLYYDATNKTWVFLNDSAAKFEYRSKGMTYTNKMYI